MSTYSDDDLLLLSGIQHFAFCERQWALIHIEKQWAESVRTVEGQQLHERVDDPFFTETRDNIKVVRSAPLVSRKLGLNGIADIVEFHEFKTIGVSKVVIVEYKRGKPKTDDRDEVQLCAQAMCLEEMLGIKVEYGYFYYGQTRHRHEVGFDEQLRGRVTQLAKGMHELFEKGITPTAHKNSKCKLCSLVDLCLPELGSKKNKAQKYISSLVAEVEKETVGEVN